MPPNRLDLVTPSTARSQFEGLATADPHTPSVKHAATSRLPHPMSRRRSRPVVPGLPAASETRPAEEPAPSSNPFGGALAGLNLPIFGAGNTATPRPAWTRFGGSGGGGSSGALSDAGLAAEDDGFEFGDLDFTSPTPRRGQSGSSFKSSSSVDNLPRGTAGKRGRGRGRGGGRDGGGGGGGDGAGGGAGGGGRGGGRERDPDDSSSEDGDSGSSRSSAPSDSDADTSSHSSSDGSGSGDSGEEGEGVWDFHAAQEERDKEGEAKIAKLTDRLTQAVGKLKKAQEQVR